MKDAGRHPGLAPLVQLNAYIRAKVAERQPAVAPGEEAPGDELASARRFRQAWASGRALDTVAEAIARKPANAGPLNSHALVLQTLERVRALSPDYLQRLLAQVESLQWLEQAVEKYPPAAGKGKPARKGRRKA